MFIYIYIYCTDIYDTDYVHNSVYMIIYCMYLTQVMLVCIFLLSPRLMFFLNQN